MRDVNKLMMESVQTHVIMGSIILGVCWNMCIEGFPPEEAVQTVRDTDRYGFHSLKPSLN